VNFSISSELNLLQIKGALKLNLSCFFRLIVGLVFGINALSLAYADCNKSLAKIHPNERYLRVTKSAEFVPGGRESGEITILSVNKNAITFNLNVSWDKFALDDGSSATTGNIEEGKMIRQANKSAYVFISSEASDVGKCQIAFNFYSEVLVVKSIVGCTSFGSHINVSGQYIKARADESIIVH
jgi:hypothetical protein